MPTQNEVKKAAARRAARKAAREQAVEKSHTEQQTLSETAAASKAKASPKKAVLSRKDQVTADRRATEEALKLQEAGNVIKEDDVDPQSYIRPGADLSLHQLNRIARRDDAARREEANQIAVAAGQAAHKAALGARQARTGGDRWSRRRDAEELVKKQAEQK